jgi:hypothetical protein
MYPAWISQRFAAARARWRAKTSLRLIRVLDVLHEHASALEPARALSSRPLRPLASRTVEKSRLDRFQAANRALILTVMMCSPFVVSCGGDFGPPELESARNSVPAEYHITYSGAAGRTVLELLEENASSVETSGYGDEFLVVSINGIANGTEGRFWFYYVNDQPGQLAASDHETSAGDRIEWLFAE